MNPIVESTHRVTAVLVLFGVWMAFVLYVILSSPLQGTKFLGGFLLAIGALNIGLYKKTARKFFVMAQSGRPFVAKFWARIGEREGQLLFLGFGIVLTVAGCVLLVVGSA